MDYIVLGRQLDTLAKNDHHKESPDDVLKLILKYTGDIHMKSTNIFSIVINFRYQWSLINYDENGNPSVSSTNKTGVKHSYCCETCGSIFNDPKSHYRSKSHQTKSNKQKTLSRTKLLKIAYKHLRKNYNSRYIIDDITSYKFGKEVYSTSDTKPMM